MVVGGDGWFELCSTVLTILTNLLHHNLDISKWNTLVVAADYKLEEIVSQHLKYTNILFLRFTGNQNRNISCQGQKITPLGLGWAELAIILLYPTTHHQGY